MKKALTLIIAAAALVVPAAQATFDASLPTTTSHAKITKAKVAKHKVAVQAKPKSTTTTNAGDRPSLVTRQSFPSTVSGLDECANTGSNCTLEQLCEFWNLSCDLVTSSTTSDSSLTAPAQTTYNDGAGT